MTERHMVVIETERTGRLEFTPEQFDTLLAAALVGLEGCPLPNADEVWAIIARRQPQARL